MAEIPKPEPTHYDHLMVARNASVDVIRAAYRTLTQRYHPDRNKDDAEATRVMQLVNESYGVLSDPEKRAEYDRQLAKQDEQNFELALEAHQALVPVLQEAPVTQGAPRKRRLRSPIASISFGFILVLIAALELFRIRYPELAQSALAPLAAHPRATIRPQPPAPPEERRGLETGAIDRHSAEPDSTSSSGSDSDSASAADSASSASRSSIASAAPAPVEHAPHLVAADPGKPAAPKPRARPVNRTAQHSAPPRQAPAPAPDPVPAAPAVSVADELAEVRSKDPAAAEHIASYCNIVAKTAIDGGTSCRRNETYAWRSFAVTSDHAKIYEEIRLRCPPNVYPDSFEAKEACVRHESVPRARVE